MLALRGDVSAVTIRLALSASSSRIHVDRVVMLAVAAYIYVELPHSDMYSPSRVYCSLVMDVISVGWPKDYLRKLRQMH